MHCTLRWSIYWQHDGLQTCLQWTLLCLLEPYPIPSLIACLRWWQLCYLVLCTWWKYPSLSWSRHFLDCVAEFCFLEGFKSLRFGRVIAECLPQAGCCVMWWWKVLIWVGLCQDVGSSVQDSTVCMCNSHIINGKAIQVRVWITRELTFIGIH